MPKRIEYIDVAKFLALLLVVFCHSFKECSFVAFAYSFHLPVFFFLSGMTLKVDGLPFGDFLVKKLRGYIVPMFGLGIITLLFSLLVREILNWPIGDKFIYEGIARIINQTRTYALWFLSALFLANLMLYGLNRLFKGRLVLMGIGTLAILGIGILFNQKYNVNLVWNFDAALFGITFTYFGFLFTHRKMATIYHLVTDRRWLALLLGAALLIGTYFLSSYNYTNYHRHLEMFFRIYTQYYITLPCALIGSLGFVLFCRGISNFVLAKPVEINLALLPLHQELAFPLFRDLVAKDYWRMVAPLPPTDYRFILFSLATMVFSLAVATAVHFFLKYSPISPVVNQPLASFYHRKKHSVAESLTDDP